MKLEFSAGGIVVKPIRHPFDKLRTRAQGKKEILVLVSQHSGHHGWVFPKGFIGDKIKAEGTKETALREVREETGVLGKIMRALKPVTYWYEFEGEKRKKTVYYFLMEYISGDIKDHDFEMENVEWISPDRVEDRLTYPSDKKVWREALKLI